MQGGNLAKLRSFEHASWGDIPDWAFTAVESLMKAFNLVDPETAAHCLRVGVNSKILAKAAGFNEFEVKVAEFAGILHDVGKMGISKEVLHKPSKLNPEEVKLMMAHPLMSVEVIKPFLTHDFFKEVATMVECHHERIDGKGYPHNLAGDRIPVLSRVILIVDAFDAMTQSRAYRKGLPKEVALKEIKDCSGTQFDSQLAKVFLELHKLEEVPLSPEQFLQQQFKKAA
jgi:HD-GYP domain-containing protein (c-di-GMP phosphodiesterase class II)